MNKILKINDKYFNINNNIKSKIIKLLDSDSNYLGIFKKKDCIIRSNLLKLDLIELSKGIYSICKLIKYGKFQYLESKKHKEIKKKYKKSLKEVRFHLFIDKNDYTNKLNAIKKFLVNKFRVKVSLNIKGREIYKKSIIRKICYELIDDLSDYGTTENKFNLNDSDIIIYFFPKN